MLHKDEVLDRLADRGNVAQFVAFRPTDRNLPKQTFARIRGHSPNDRFLNPRQAIDALLTASSEGRVNVRSYLPDDPRSKDFVYGLGTTDDAVDTLISLTSAGLHTIVNETIDVCDGGVSGVVQGGTIEFTPDDTPRGVEKPGIASLPFDQGLKLLEMVYGFAPELASAEGDRTEFSIHPKARGWRHSHTILWEHESGLVFAPHTALRWPNRFSRMIGDKAFGLMMADRLGVPVPRTLVIPRRIAPFRFGRETGSGEVWTRTCPTEPQPGLYTTVKGWIDPFALLQAEDPTKECLASVLCQDAVPALYSGAAIVNELGKLTIEGRSGEGDRLMLGLDRPEQLPDKVLDDVRAVQARLSEPLGPVRLEWVHDGVRVWVVQLHLGATQSDGVTVVPGEAERWVEIPVELGLANLRATLSCLEPGDGALLVGDVGMTSHIADLVRKAGLPARLTHQSSQG